MRRNATAFQPGLRDVKARIGAQLRIEGIPKSREGLRSFISGNIRSSIVVVRPQADKYREKGKNQKVA